MTLLLLVSLVAVTFFIPLSWLAWVRGAAGRLWGRVAGRARASQPSAPEPAPEAPSAPAGVNLWRAEVMATSANKPILDAPAQPSGGRSVSWGRALANLGGFIWRYKWALLVLVIFIFGVSVLRGCTPGLPGFKSKADLRAELREARAENEARKTEALIAEYAGRRGDETQARERRIERAVSQGQREIEHASTQDDFDALYRAYAGAYGRVWNDSPDPGDDDPASRGSERVRSPGAYGA